MLATNVDELKHIALSGLETSNVFDNTSRNLIANDIIDNRYDLLLLHDRFDCDVIPRIVTNSDIIENEEDTNECPICLGASTVDCFLPCNHAFCRVCIENWSSRNNTQPNCPLCRQSYTLDDISSYDN